jgi:putative iron-regulated protein
MAKFLKTWTALGLATLGAANVAQATVLSTHQSAATQYILTAGGEGGEGGGEGGGAGSTNTTIYSLNSTDADAFNYDATQQIDAYIDLAFKSYEKAADDAKLLQAAVDAFLDAPSDDTLKAARQAWLAARPAYLKTEAFRFYGGPIDAVESEINAWPVNEAYIDSVRGKADAGLVNDPSVKLDVDTLEGLNQKQDEADVTIGWHAVEFLLWGQDESATGPGNRPYTDYIAGQASTDRRRQYLKLVTHQLAKELHDLEESWEFEEANSYANAFKALPPREAVGRMVNGLAILAGYELMSERMGVALDSGDQEDEQSCFSDSTKSDFVYDLVGIRQVWTGDTEDKSRAGLNDLVKAIDPALATQVDTALANAEIRIAALGDPWDQVLAAPKGSPARLAAEDAVTALQHLGDAFSAVGKKLGVLVLIPTE